MTFLLMAHATAVGIVQALADQPRLRAAQDDPRLRAFPIETMTILRMAMEADLRGWRSPQSADAV
jgi:hypothetical protein